MLASSFLASKAYLRALAARARRISDRRYQGAALLNQEVHVSSYMGIMYRRSEMHQALALAGMSHHQRNSIDDDICAVTSKASAQAEN